MWNSSRAIEFSAVCVQHGFLSMIGLPPLAARACGNDQSTPLFTH
jgi:hypothetical protein